MTRLLEEKTKELIRKIQIIYLEDIDYIDPTMLLILEGKAKANTEEKGATFAFIHIKTIGEVKSYHYLKMNTGYISERYLYNPISHKIFLRKKQCDSLWHKKTAPSLEEISHHAKELRFQEL